MNGGMSAIGTKRTCESRQSTSAFGVRADIVWAFASSFATGLGALGN
jgi:hypothetical protein